MERCEACKGKGWLLVGKDNLLLEMQRCDSCDRYDDDDEAVKAVAQQHENLTVKAEALLTWVTDMLERQDRSQEIIVEMREALADSKGEPVAIRLAELKRATRIKVFLNGEWVEEWRDSNAECENCCTNDDPWVQDSNGIGFCSACLLDMGCSIEILETETDGEDTADRN